MEDVEVNPKEALAEGKEDVIDTSDQAADQPEPNGDGPAPRDVIDTIQPKAQPKAWKLGPPDDPEKQREYVQRPLSYFGKMQFFALVGQVIDKALSGEDGLKLGSLFGGTPAISREGVIRMSDFSDAETFMQAVAKILVYAPDFLEKSYCIWLGVPDFERPWAISMMNLQKDEGGLSDEDGLEIVNIFIDQNWEAIEGFFRDQIPKVRDRIQVHRKAVEESRPSKPSNTTPERTPSA